MITIRFVAARDPISAIVRMGTYGFAYSHVEFVLADGSAIGSHARTGVAITPKGYAGRWQTSTRSVALPCTETQEAALVAFLRAQLGRPYDFLAILAIATSFFLGPRNWRSPDAWFCSELVTAALEAAGIMSCIIEDTSRITPRDCMIFLSTHGEAVWAEPIQSSREQ